MPTPGDRPWERRAPAAFVALVLAALLVLLGLLLAQAHDHRTRDVARRAAVQAARQEAVNLTTIGYATAGRDVDRIIAGATGPLRQQFAAERSQLNALTQGRSRSRGNVLAAGLTRLDVGAGTARVAVAADAQVTATPPGTSTPQSTLKHYRMVMTLRRIGGRWLVSDVAFAGLQQ